MPPLDLAKFASPLRSLTRCQGKVEMSYSSKVEMSSLRGKAEGCGLEWSRPRGVAPERMPKAEATTGLAPKKASATDL